MYSTVDITKVNAAAVVVEMHPNTQSILTGATSSHYAGNLMKQTLVSSHLSHYVGSKDPMYKTSYSRMGLPQ